MELKELSNKFYSIYNTKNYPNILRKRRRSYTLYNLEVGKNKHGLPVKTNIKSSAGFSFKESDRKKPEENPGLDFMHAVILTEESYIGRDGHIDEK